MAQICHQQLTFLKAFFQEKKKVLDKASYLLVNGRVPITVVKYYLEKKFFLAAMDFSQNFLLLQELHIAWVRHFVVITLSIRGIFQIQSTPPWV